MVKRWSRLGGPMLIPMTCTSDHCTGRYSPTSFISALSIRIFFYPARWAPMLFQTPTWSLRHYAWGIVLSVTTCLHLRVVFDLPHVVLIHQPRWETSLPVTVAS